MKKFKFETLNEIVKGEKYYALFKISLEKNDGYCIAVLDDDFSAQGVGGDVSIAKDIYRLLSCGEVSSIHVADVIRDLQNEIFV